MCMVYGVCSQKGGVGKSSLAFNFGVALAKKGNRVLLLDGDAQGSMTASMGYQEPDSIEDTLASVIEMEVNDIDYDARTFGILHHKEGVDVLPSNIELSGLEISLVGVWSRELMLRRYIEKLRDFYDVIIVDSAPSLGLITLNILSAADKIIIPVQAAYLSLKGLEQLIKTIGKVKKSLNPRVGIEGILITMLDGRTNYAKDIVELLDQTYGTAVRIFDTKIPFSVRAAEATAEGVSIFAHDPRGKVAAAYQSFTEEVLAGE